ncbi:MAG: Cna B-type domain-containing protein [Clostridia bacterium]|nr:Cna B-type domain-containing protein [Clostridia bacterium]
MKNNIGRSRMGRALAVLLAALLLAGLLSVGGALGEQPTTGSLNVMLKASTYARLPKDAEVTITLYKIGSMDLTVPGGWRINDDLADYGVLAADTSGKLGEIAEKMAADIAGRYPGMSQKLTKGVATFGDLELGVYLGAMTKGPKELTVQPFIVTVPFRDQETLALLYDYDVTVKDKIGESTPVPTPSTTPPTETSTPPPTTRVTGQKIWEDDGNANKTRPKTIIVQLYADGVLVDAEPNWTNTDSDTWSYAFENLPAENEGVAIEYTVKEIPVTYYETSVVGTTIVNKLVPPKPKYREFSGQKTWNDDGNADGKRPTYITVRLLRNGTEVEKRIVTAATDWQYSFGKQPLDDGYGHAYSYTMVEDGVDGYFSRVKGTNVTNTRLPEKPHEPPKKRRPSFTRLTDEELDELLDLFDYETPLWGGLLGTGYETPVWPYVSAGVGALAVIGLVVTRKRRKHGDTKR